MPKPLVSDAMSTIHGFVREHVREILSYRNAVLRRTYRAASGRGSAWWTLLTVDRIDAVSVHRVTVLRWAKNGWVDLYFDPPTDFAPNRGTEWCVLRRCDWCGCVGYEINGDSRCQECAELSDDDYDQQAKTVGEGE